MPSGRLRHCDRGRSPQAEQPERPLHFRVHKGRSAVGQAHLKASPTKRAKVTCRECLHCRRAKARSTMRSPARHLPRLVVAVEVDGQPAAMRYPRVPNRPRPASTLKNIRDDVFAPVSWREHPEVSRHSTCCSNSGILRVAWDAGHERCRLRESLVCTIALAGQLAVAKPPGPQSSSPYRAGRAGQEPARFPRSRPGGSRGRCRTGR